MNRRCTILLFLLACAAPVCAQPPAHAEVQRVISRLFDGMRRGDSTAVRGVFHAGATLQTTYTDKQTGRPVLRTESIDGLVRAVGTPHPEPWDERLDSTEIRVDDNLATVWAPYSFYVGNKFSHRGVNAFQLFKTESGWKIIAITDTRRK